MSQKRRLRYFFNIAKKDKYRNKKKNMAPTEVVANPPYRLMVTLAQLSLKEVLSIVGAKRTCIRVNNKQKMIFAQKSALSSRRKTKVYSGKQ